MKISLHSVSKHFGREVVFRDLSHVFEPGSRTAILGPNGSGKSTLLQLVGGVLMPTKGSVGHALAEKELPAEEVYRHISIAAPYLNLYEDLTLRETIENHVRFKPMRSAIAAMDLARLARLEDAWNKPVRNFSSGMKQRLKLALAILNDTPLLLLDEPASNLDTDGIAWFREMLAQHMDGRTLLVASNRQAEETFACTAVMEVGYR